MIHYNMRYRGAYEYDKFVLNILQYANDANEFIGDMTKLQDFETLKVLYDEVNALYERSTGPEGSSEKCYKQLIMFKEAK